MNHWLLKSEPSEFSFDDLKKRPGRREPWTGVRNYQVRNFMRDLMRPGDAGLFYHSSCAKPGVAGVVRIASEAFPDPMQFEPSSPYFDPSSPRDRPRWLAVDVEWVADLARCVGLEELRRDAALSGLLILRPGNRLSITPVAAADFRHICRLGGIRSS